MRQNYIWWQGSSSGDLVSVGQIVISMTPKSIDKQRDIICYGPILGSNRDLFKKYSYSIGQRKQK